MPAAISGGNFMHISMKCSLAVHCLIFVHEAAGKCKVTSAMLAESTGSNPVIIRNILSALKKAGIIEVRRGTGGAVLTQASEAISLYQIHNAVDPQGLNALIGIHPCDKRSCLVAQNIRPVLKKPYEKIKASIKKTMEEITLASLINDFHKECTYFCACYNKEC